ncbi:MAG TPA: MBL fold metallo-hydrolase [Thermoanaerobaculia bacterium]|jgi:beta-lactamase superfamily II metal-dependent hydrolase
MFRVHLLPAGHGDCIWIEYGTAGQTHRVLIDAGTPGTYKRLKQRIGKQPMHFELFVITHIDADHIGGAIKLLSDANVTYDDIWFNGWDHINGRVPAMTALGSKQAEAVSQLIVDRKLPWNRAFGGAAVVLTRAPLTKTLPGGMTLTLLSPYREQLTKLIPDWEKELRAATLKPKRRESPLALGGDEALDVDTLAAEAFESDTAAANGSSIAFIAEYKRKRALFTGDAHVPVLLDSLKKLQPAGAMKIDLLKLAHHGAGGNTSNDLLKRLTCPRYLISSNGAYFKHPERTAIARIVKRSGKKKLIFNYATQFNSMWRDAGLQSKYKYETSYPADEVSGAVIDL